MPRKNISRAMIVGLVLSTLSIAGQSWATGRTDIGFQSTPYSFQSSMSSTATPSAPAGGFLLADSGSARAQDFYVEFNWAHSDGYTISAVADVANIANQIAQFNSRVIACKTSSTSFSYPIITAGIPPVPTIDNDCLEVESSEVRGEQWQVWVEWKAYACIPAANQYLYVEFLFEDRYLDGGTPRTDWLNLSFKDSFVLNTAQQNIYLSGGGSCETLSPGDPVDSSLFRSGSSGGSGGSSSGGSGGSSSGGSGGSSSGGSGAGPSGSPLEDRVPPSPKVPAFNQFANGPMFVTPGVAATLTGNRLGCTTEIQINDVATSFTRSYLGDGTQQLNIAIPTNLQPGRHKMSMDSCGGQVEFSNLLVVPKAPAVFEMVTRNSIERGLALARLQSFLLTNMNDYNSVECIVNVKAPNLQTAARQLLADACNRAVTMLRATSSTSELRNTHLPTNIWVRITLSNK